MCRCACSAKINYLFACSSLAGHLSRHLPLSSHSTASCSVCLHLSTLSALFNRNDGMRWFRSICYTQASLFIYKCIVLVAIFAIFYSADLDWSDGLAISVGTRRPRAWQSRISGGRGAKSLIRRSITWTTCTECSFNHNNTIENEQQKHCHKKSLIWIL